MCFCLAVMASVPRGTSLSGGLSIIMPRPDAEATTGAVSVRGVDWTKLGESCLRLVPRLLSPLAPSSPSGLLSVCTFDLDLSGSQVPVVHDCKSSITTLEVRANVGAASTAAFADEPRLDIRQPNIIRPAIGAQRNVVPAMAVDQHIAQPHLAHLAERDREWPAVGVRRSVASDWARHAAIKAAP